MRKFLMALTAVSLILPVASISFPTQAEARKKHSAPRVYTRNGKTYCRHSDGTTGLIIGGVGGAVVGNALGGGLLGTVAGGVGGAFGGRAIDRSITAKKRCR
ncbi:MAG: hypothetical protein K2X59_02345 [Sphingomonas sp.]|nr:hypothetical protein [Sphingomonas sp.]